MAEVTSTVLKDNHQSNGNSDGMQSMLKSPNYDTPMNADDSDLRSGDRRPEAYDSRAASQGDGSRQFNNDDAGGAQRATYISSTATQPDGDASIGHSLYKQASQSSQYQQQNQHKPINSSGLTRNYVRLAARSPEAGSNSLAEHGGSNGSFNNTFTKSQSQPAASRTSTVVNGTIYRALYSGVQVFEIIVDGIAVMRRVDDSRLNATQILKVAGVEKSKRTKVIEREIMTGEYEKVQGGYGKYQGTWIPFETAVELCKQYHVYNKLSPLLQFDSSNAGMENTPTKEQALAAERKNNPTHKSPFSSFYNTSQQQPALQVNPGSSALSHSATAALMSFRQDSLGSPRQQTDSPLQYGDSYQQPRNGANYQSVYEHYAGQARKMQSSNSPHLQTPEQQVRSQPSSGKRSYRNMGDDDEPPQSGESASPYVHVAAGDVLDDENIPDTILPLDPLDVETPHFEESRDAITLVFLEGGGGVHDLDAYLQGKEGTINVDVPIDDHGHTGLHWACALGQVNLVRDLIKHGAQSRRGNTLGESPLIRAVMVTNNYDYSSFPALLDLIYPGIPLVDQQNRTVLHHIALTAAIKGRSDASKYYLESLLEWIVRRGARSKTGKFGIGRFMSEIVNAQDKNGDTALNIAARVGNRSIASQLLEVGADATIANRAGLRAADFGIRVNQNEVRRGLQYDGSPMTRVSSRYSTAGEGNSGVSGADKRQKIVQSITRVFSDLETGFDSELKTKEGFINSLHEQLKESSATLASRRAHLEKLKNLSNKLTEWQRSSQNLERAVQEEDKRFKLEDGQNGASADGGESIDNSGYESKSSNGEDSKSEKQSSSANMLLQFEGNFDADQPFRVWLDNPEELKNYPPALLGARVAAYKSNKQRLESLANELQSRSTKLESKFRRIISLCTGVEESQVDTLLPSLVQAVESDPPNVDTARLSEVLRTVHEDVS